MQCVVLHPSCYSHPQWRHLNDPWPLISTQVPTRSSPLRMGVPEHGFGPLHLARLVDEYSKPVVLLVFSPVLFC